MQEGKVRKIAADILATRQNSLWFNPKEAEKVQSVMTRDDVRQLIKDGVIKKLVKNRQSKARARILQTKKKKGRKSGHGKRKGTKKSRTEKKPTWIKNVRSQRKMLRQLRKENPKGVKKLGYRKLYKRVKGGYFKGKKYLKAAVEGKK